VLDDALRLVAPDGFAATLRLPFAQAYDGPATASGLLQHLVVPARWGVLLVRKGGFAVAVLAGGEVEASKVGSRHVQGRTKAGGQSQQRFARRRDNQARAAYEAAAEHAARVLSGPVRALVCGGDRQAVERVLADARLGRLAEVRVAPWLDVPDPRREVLDRAVADAMAVQVTVSEPPGGSHGDHADGAGTHEAD
jgi:hypothetical protein